MLAAGTRLGPYEVNAALGAGGMGEVYAATDTRLGRRVALKILPPELARNPERRARFEREARSIARLEHPHICTLHDVGENYLVMELLEGETLAQRLGRGALPLRDVVRYGSEIAEALERAHRSGVVHRDLKPSNVMLTKSGAKLLDFGLAKMSGTVEVSPDSLTRDPSLTSEGTIVGSFPYMAPEQVEGREADARTDVFALGALLYEMATGRRAFEGGTHAAVIGAILERQPPPPSSVVPSLPQALDRLIAKCLEKDPDERWQSAKDVAIQLASIADAAVAAPPANPRLVWMVAVLASIALLLAIAFGVTTARSRAYAPGIEPSSMPAESVIRPPKEWVFASPYVRPFSVSPDGSHIIYTLMGVRKPTALVLRSLEGRKTIVIENSDRAFWPFWSPDGRYVGFSQNGTLKKMPLDGGGPVTISPAPSAGRGAAWSRWGTIVFVNREGVFAISADGGEPETIVTASDEMSYSDPDFLPDGTHYLLTTYDRNRRATIVVRRLGGEWEKRLVQDASNGRWLESGHLLFVRGETLLAQRLDPMRIELLGEPTVVLQRLGVERRENMGALFSASRNGKILAYQPSGWMNFQLKHFDRQGKVLSELAGPARIGEPVLSNDRTRVAVTIEEPSGNAYIWVIDLRSGVTMRLTTEPTNDGYPVWSPDDAFIAYGGDSGLYRVPARGGPPELLLKSERRVRPTSWSPDGGTILLTERDRPGIYDIVAFRLADRSTAPVVATEFGERDARFSPDGQWILYTSDDAGSMDVYVRRWRDGSQRARITPKGGSPGYWSADGKRIYVQYSIFDVSLGDEVVATRVGLLFDKFPENFLTQPWFCVMPDETVIGFTRDDNSQWMEIRVLSDWSTRLP
jgi:serine/threonine protein kinase/Tol biopolymer transport system component